MVYLFPTWCHIFQLSLFFRWNRQPKQNVDNYLHQTWIDGNKIAWMGKWHGGMKQIEGFQKRTKPMKQSFHVFCVLCLTVAELRPWVCDIVLLTAVNFETLFTPAGLMSNKQYYTPLSESKSIVSRFLKGPARFRPEVSHPTQWDVVRKESKTACQDQQLLGRLSHVSHNPTKSFPYNLSFPTFLHLTPILLFGLVKCNDLHP